MPVQTIMPRHAFPFLTDRGMVPTFLTHTAHYSVTIHINARVGLPFSRAGLTDGPARLFRSGRAG